MLSLVVAVAENGVIGRDNGLPWRLPGDLQYFKRITMGKPLIMGRKTFESIGRPLPGRTNIVVTRDPAWTAEGVVVANSLPRAVDLAQEVAATGGAGEVMVIGGAEIYAAALPRADRIYLTEVHAAVDGDARLPRLDRAEWREVSRERRVAAAGDQFDYSFVVFERQAQRAVLPRKCSST